MSTVRDLINKLLIYPPEETIAYLILHVDDVKAMNDDYDISEGAASRALTIAHSKFDKRNGNVLDVLGKAVLKALREEEDAKLNMDRYSNWLK